MIDKIKELVKGNVYFVCYRKGNLWYEAGRHLTGPPVEFPVPIEDIGDGVFCHVEKGIYLMRYIRKHLELIANA